MSAADSLILELEQVLQHGSQHKRTEALERITSLFVTGASRYTSDHVSLFGDIFGRLIAEIEMKARAQLSRRLAPVKNAPAEVVRYLAQDDDISIAGPMLAQSGRLEEADLLEIARYKSQAHLLAISGRNGIGEAITEVLVKRGDLDVVRNVADNRQARLSEASFSTLVRRAGSDGILAEKVGQRHDIPARLFRDLLFQATDVVQQRLLAKAKPETAEEIRRVLAKVSREIGAKAAPRDYASAQRSVLALRDAGDLSETQLCEFANEKRFEETIVSLALLCGVPLEVADRLMGGDRWDPVLILCKAAGFSWQTVRAIMLSRPGARGTSTQGLDEAYANFDKLSSATAKRVVHFWQVRPGNGKERS
jgi:uncharacterized protein (DUF2336 family)